LTPPQPPPTDPWLAGFVLGDWRVDVGGNRLLRGTETRPLRHKAMELLLLLLARHAGRTVTRDEIVEAVWAGNRFVAPKAINTAVWTIRQALGDDPEAPQYLETIAKKGYRLLAPVSLLAADGPPVPPAARPTPAPAAELPTLVPQAAVAVPGRPRVPWRPVAAVLLVAVGVGFVVLRPMLDGRAGERAAAPAASAALATVSRPEALTGEPGVEYLGALSPDGTRLAFAWWRGRGVGQLHLRRLDEPGAAARALAPEAGDVYGLAWVDQGRALALTAVTPEGRCGLWVVPAVGGVPRRIADCAPLVTPTLAASPDGRQLVFSGERDGAGGLFLIAPDGSGLQRLTTSPPAAMADHQPAWAPDARHVAFVRQDPADGTRDLFEVAPGGPAIRLTTLKLHFVHGLAHAGDGRDLIFSTTRQDIRVLQRWERGAGRVVPLGLEGSAPVRAPDGGLVYSLMRTHVSIARTAFRGAPVRTLQAVASDRVPRPDPAGRRLAFVSRRSGAPELWLSAPDGSGARALTALGGYVEEPAWAPGGDRLAFVGSCGPGRRVGLCAVGDDGQALRPLVADAADYGAPAWHPRRDEVWVASDRGGQWQLWRFPGAGGPGVAEPTERPPGRTLQWLDDGSGFVYRPRGERQLRLRPTTGPEAGRERPIEVAATGEELVDWRLAAGRIVTLTRSDRERWRRVDVASGRREALGEHPLGTFPERASFALAGVDAVWVEVANTQVADLMRLR
jgi:Tol biopolymer transport system component/DNA-binding winged helix-turn-helix (wHTH) protein